MEQIYPQYKPENEKKSAAPLGAETSGDSGLCPGLEGIALRRLIGLEPKNRAKSCIYIERELLQALPDSVDLNFQVNLALEHLITKHQGARVAVQNLED